MPVETEYYERLGVDPNADEKTIKKAYRKMAMKYHPDRHASSTEEEKEAAAEKFKEISEAYEVLSDPEKKQTYDQFGKEAANNGGGGGMPAGFEEVFAGMGGMGGFEEIFGGIFGGGRQRGPQKLTIDPIEVSVHFTLLEAYTGCSKIIDVVVKLIDGEDDLSFEECICSKCKGRGSIIVVQRMGPMVQQMQQPCAECQGEGVRMNRFKDQKKRYRKKFAPGIRDDWHIVIKNKGSQIPRAMLSDPDDMKDSYSDVIIVPRVAPRYVEPESNTAYELRQDNVGCNLETTVELTAELAICGGYIEMKHIDGSDFVLQVPKGICFKKSKEIVIPNMGMPLYGVVEDDEQQYGYLFIEFELSNIDIPDEISGQIFQTLSGVTMEEAKTAILDDESDAFEGTNFGEHRKTEAHRETLRNIQECMDSVQRNKKDLHNRIREMHSIMKDIPN